MSISTDEHVALQEMTGAKVLEILGAANRKFRGNELPFEGTLGGIAYQNATLTIREQGVTLVTPDGASRSYDFNNTGNYKTGRWLPSVDQAVDLLKWIELRV